MNDVERLTKFMEDLDAKYQAKWKAEHRFEYSFENMLAKSKPEENDEKESEE